MPVALAALAMPIAANAASINQRASEQQARVAQSAKTGALTYGQEKRAEARDAKIVRQETIDRLRNNGHLTGFERRMLNRELKRNSRTIAREKRAAALRAL